MTIAEIHEALAVLTETAQALEAEYIESGGVMTEQTEAMQARLAAEKELLTSQGVDELGRWLKAKQDQIAAAKAEVAAAQARVKSLQQTEDYIKSEVAYLLAVIGMEEAKGTYYSFSRYQSRSTSVQQEKLDEAYLAIVTAAARKAGLPDCIDVALKTTTSRLKEAGDKFSDMWLESVSPSVKFSKPRAVKE